MECDIIMTQLMQINSFYELKQHEGQVLWRHFRLFELFTGEENIPLIFIHLQNLERTLKREINESHLLCMINDWQFVLCEKDWDRGSCIASA